MQYRYLGNSGLKVSVFGLGNWINSDDESTLERNIEIVKKAYDSGINFFDTAEMYGNGQGEIVLGKALKALDAPRENIVVCNKLFFGPQGAQNGQGLSRKKIIESCKASLKRMQLEYFDVILAHVYDYNTPIEETCRAFHWLIENGFAFYWGTSNWPVQRTMEAMRICDKYGLHKPILEQCEYNMFVRKDIEAEMTELYNGYKYGTTVYSPLCGGLLTGKYNKEIPEGSRYSQPWVANHTYTTFEKYLETEKDKTTEKLRELGKLAKEMDCTQAQLALAWTIANKDVNLAILGATKVSQLEENIKALDVVSKLNGTTEKKINEILKNKPEQLVDCANNFASYQDRRSKYIF